MYMATTMRRYRKAAMTEASMAMMASRQLLASTAAVDHVELGEEAGGERHAGLGEQEDREREGQHRVERGQAL